MSFGSIIANGYHSLQIHCRHLYSASSTGDETMVGDGRRVDADVAQGTVVERYDDIQSSSFALGLLGDVLSKPILIQNVQKVHCMRQARVFQVNIQVTSNEELCVEEGELLKEQSKFAKKGRRRQSGAGSVYG